MAFERRRPGRPPKRKRDPGPGRPRKSTVVEADQQPIAEIENVPKAAGRIVPVPQTPSFSISQASSATLLQDSAQRGASPIRVETAPRPRGRPKKSKDKPKDPTPARKGGRPKGSKDKIPAEERRTPRGRPRKHPKPETSNHQYGKVSPLLGSSDGCERITAPLFGSTRIGHDLEQSGEAAANESAHEHFLDFDTNDDVEQDDASAEQLQDEGVTHATLQAPKRQSWQPMAQAALDVINRVVQRRDTDKLAQTIVPASPRSHQFIMGVQHPHGTLSLTGLEVTITKPVASISSLADTKIQGTIRLKYQGPPDGGQAFLPVGQDLVFHLSGEREA